MRIEGGKIKPCSTCLKARQRTKDLVAALSGTKITRKQRIETSNCEIVTENRIVVEVSNEDFKGIVGSRVYLAGKRVLNVQTANVFPGLGHIVSVIDIV